jgi:hypothetical protein
LAAGAAAAGWLGAGVADAAGACSGVLVHAAIAATAIADPMTFKERRNMTDGLR